MAVVILVTAALIFLDRFEDPPHLGLKLLMGMAFGALGPIVGRHITNLLLLREFGRNPELLKDHRPVSPRLALRISQFGLLSWLPLLVIIALIMPNPYTLGIVVGLLAMVFVHSVWRRRADAQPAP